VQYRSFGNNSNFSYSIITNMELKGQGFTLRGWYKEDAELLQKHADNINISNYLFDRFPSPYTMADAEAFVSRKLNQNPITSFVIAIDDQLAGVIGIDFREDIYRKAPLLGYWLAEEYWGQGIMTVVKLVADYAFENLDIVRLQSGVLANNPGSMRVLEKAGFLKEGVLRNNIIKNGVIMDEYIYGMVR
jgi:ribosomal-protein-alanine N-acetyltransferase